MVDRVILHCDMNSFYASVELLDHPELRHLPVAVCGDPESRHGVILAKNEAAKAYGVKTAETVWQARKKCPDLHLLAAHHDKYHHYSRQVNAIYERFTDLVEPFSVDESWLDVTNTLHLFHTDGKGLGDLIRQTVREELDLTISVGVSFNKIFAKMGSDYKKPDATTLISRENFQDLLWPLPITDLIFVGRAAAKTLGEYGIQTIGDLARFDENALVRLLGKQGSTLYSCATGTEHAPVIPARDMPPPKSVGNGLTFPRNLVGWEDLQGGISLLSDEVAARLRQLDMKCATVSIAVRDPNFKDISRQRGLSVPSYLAREIAQVAMALLRESWSSGAPVRALTVTAQNLLPADQAGEQLDLFAPQAAPQRQKVERLERTMDTIRGKYGREIISPARLKQNKGDTSLEEK